MIKRILKIIALVLLLAYLVAAYVLWGNKLGETVCEHFYISVLDSAENDLITPADLYAYLDNAHLLPEGKQRKDVNTYAIEHSVRDIDLVDMVECYQEANGDVFLKVSLRKPIMRVYTDMGKTYYIASDGKPLAVDTMYVDRVPLVTGCIDDTVTVDMLRPLVEYVAQHEFWSAQVAQIEVSPLHEVLLYPRVGNHVIVLGNLQGYQSKMNTLLAVHEQVLPQVGWNTYDTISVKYKDYVVCTRRDKKYRHKTWTKKNLSTYE